MPIPMLQSMAAKTGKSLKEVEKLWDKAQSIAKDKVDTEDFYAYATGVLKRSLGVVEESGLVTFAQQNSFPKVETATKIKFGGKVYKTVYDIPNIWVMNITDSSFIVEAAYDPANATLLLALDGTKFNKWYIYYKVPVKVFVEFTNETSKGSYFAKKIKGKYESELYEG